MVSRGQAVPYAQERFAGHRLRVANALREGPLSETTALRNLAVDADPRLLRAP
jgi:hypothetical protein